MDPKAASASAAITEGCTNRGVEIVDDTFLRYLASYSGIERLVIRNCIDTAELAHFFWESAVPCHANTLAELVCPAYYEGTWCFGTHSIARVSQLRRLESLEMTMNSDSMGTGPLKEVVVSLRNIAMLAAMPARQDIPRRCETQLFAHMQTIQWEIDETVKSFGTADQSPEVARLIESHYQRSKLYGNEHLY
ncbi:hypothetical protein B0H13DRAFT_2291515 [Mycena leptocephala]|nr:hypothetical protein B0H13DRAFT_2291515 [Mycena leptocephala]